MFPYTKGPPSSVFLRVGQWLAGQASMTRVATSATGFCFDDAGRASVLENSKPGNAKTKYEQHDHSTLGHPRLSKALSSGLVAR
jgi:hypothetical protein